MTAQMRIDQAGLPAGNPGFARTDGLDTGALVTLTSLAAATSSRFELLWVPPGDTTAVGSLTGISATTWTFSPTAGVYGSYRILLVTDEGLPSEDRQVRTLGIRTPFASLLVPAANESADPTATLSSASAATISRAEQNEPFGPFVAGSSWGWWRSFDELVGVVEALVAAGPSPTPTSLVVSVPIENGVTLAPGDGVAAGPTAGRCALSDAIADAATSFLGVCLVGGTGDAGGTVSAQLVVGGLVSSVAGLTPNAPVYLSTAVAGGITSTVPAGVGNRSLRVGWAFDASSFVLHVGEGMVL